VENDLQAIVTQAEAILTAVRSRADWEQAKATILGPNGSLTQAAKGIGKLSKEERPAFGQALNQTKKKVEGCFKTSLELIETQADINSLERSRTHLFPLSPTTSVALIL